MGLLSWVREKLNPAQQYIQRESGTSVPSTNSARKSISIQNAFRDLHFVNRGVNMLVSAAASLDYDIKDSLSDAVVAGVRAKSLNKLLNFRPNPYQSTQDFRQALFTDLVMDGNAFVYYDGAFIYHLPAKGVEILTDSKVYISGYKYGDQTFTPDEVFYFKDVGSTSIYRGESRLVSSAASIETISSMMEMQGNFFDNGAAFGTVFCSDNTLSTLAKEKTINYWIQNYKPKLGSRRPLILDSGLKPYPLAQSSFKEMDFDTSFKTHSEKILEALGIPPVLFNGGNNANISPNLRLFYLETVLPMVAKYTSALERFFGFDISPITNEVSALQPELKDQAAYYSTLVNSGIISPNEARVEIRFEKIAGHDALRIPANIAGSAANPSEGGKPPKPKE